VTARGCCHDSGVGGDDDFVDGVGFSRLVSSQTVLCPLSHLALRIDNEESAAEGLATQLGVYISSAPY